MIRKLLVKIKQFWVWVFKQLKDKTNIIIFVICYVLLSCEVWIPYLIGFITGNEWWYAVGSVCWAFWLAPFTPFTAICLGMTFGIRKIYDKIKKKGG